MSPELRQTAAASFATLGYPTTRDEEWRFTYVGVGQYFTNSVTEIAAGEGAIVEHHKLQQESPSAFHIATLQTQQEPGCAFQSHSISFGGALVRNDVNSILAEGAECSLNGLY